MVELQGSGSEDPVTLLTQHAQNWELCSIHKSFSTSENLAPRRNASVNMASPAVIGTVSLLSIVQKAEFIPCINTMLDFILRYERDRQLCFRDFYVTRARGTQTDRHYRENGFQDLNNS